MLSNQKAEQYPVDHQGSSNACLQAMWRNPLGQALPVGVKTWWPSRIYKKLDPHPRLVKVIHWDALERALTMEFMTNGCLKDYPFSDGKISVRQRLRWVREEAEGLQLLHSAHVIPCDVEPKNFLLAADRFWWLFVGRFGSISMSGNKICTARIEFSRRSFMVYHDRSIPISGTRVNRSIQSKEKKNTKGKTEWKFHIFWFARLEQIQRTPSRWEPGRGKFIWAT